jgi:predicted Zn-dependent protease
VKSVSLNRTKRLQKIIATGIFLTVVSCQPVPLTGRNQLILVPDSQVLSMSFSQYQGFLSSHQVISNTQEADEVARVGSRIQHAVEQYLQTHDLADRLKGYNWEFHLVKDSAINAWCMPGGKVVVYTGIMPVTQDENGLAVVLGHEISHAVADHGGERLSQALLVELGGIGLQEALSAKPQETQQIASAAFGLGTEVGVLLPFSRTQESEADHLGLIFMAMAGYDPHTAIDFWQRMMSGNKGGAPPEFLSDHPADQKRIEDIKVMMPEALRYYTPSRK